MSRYAFIDKLRLFCFNLQVVKALAVLLYTLNILDTTVTLLALKTGLGFEANFFVRSIMHVSMPLAIAMKLVLPLLACFALYKLAKNQREKRFLPIMMGALIALVIIYCRTVADGILVILK